MVLENFNVAAIDTAVAIAGSLCLCTSQTRHHASLQAQRVACTGRYSRGDVCRRDWACNQLCTTTRVLTIASTPCRLQEVIASNSRHLRHAHGCLQASAPQLLHSLEPRNYQLVPPQELMLPYE